MLTITEILGLSGGGLLVLLTLIQIAPIKMDPWSAIARGIGKAINGEVAGKVDELRKDIIELRSDVMDIQAVADEREVTQCRRRILAFNDELLHDEKHTKESFDQILMDITTYEGYCDNHKHFKNGIAVSAIENIHKKYSKCQDEHSFL